MSRQLHQRVWGSGPRTVVLLHGSTSSSSTWWQVGPRLAESGWTVTAFDLPSHGSSPAARVPLTPQVAAPP
jgi:pimeloyl-ACP methyl ester carboxylesterase